MSVRYWGANAGWLVTYNQCLKSRDLETWEKVEGLRWNDDEAYNFGQIYPFDDPNSDYIYLYAIPGGRSGGLVCARVLENEFEIITFTHKVLNRNIFAIGALKAATWLLNQENGLYSFEDVYDE